MQVHNSALHDKGCLIPKVVGVHGGSDDLHPANGQRYIVVCEGLISSGLASSLVICVVLLFLFLGFFPCFYSFWGKVRVSRFTATVTLSLPHVNACDDYHIVVATLAYLGS